MKLKDLFPSLSHTRMSLCILQGFIEVFMSCLCILSPSGQVIEEMISMQEPAMRVIRLMCLQSATDAGVKSSKYEFLKREVVQVR